VYRDLIHRAAAGCEISAILKTDLFEEACGEDQVLFDLGFSKANTVGIDAAHSIAARARSRSENSKFSFVTADVRRLPFPAGHFDLVFSNSTLDHFDNAPDLERSIGELVRITRPGGLLVLTLDNPWNPLYWALRACSRCGYTPFPMGYTLSASKLQRRLREAGFEVLRTDWLIHNPRLISTGLFLLMRRALRSRADAPIAALLRLFARFGRLPAKCFTACFVAVSARKSVS
jgi:SAM-dependent methyltransferase